MGCPQRGGFHTPLLKRGGGVEPAALSTRRTSCFWMVAWDRSRRCPPPFRDLSMPGREDQSRIGDGKMRGPISKTRLAANSEFVDCNIEGPFVMQLEQRSRAAADAPPPLSSSFTERAPSLQHLRYNQPRQEQRHAWPNDHCCQNDQHRDQHDHGILQRIA